MRIRLYRQGDIPTLVSIQQLAAQADDTEKHTTADFESWFAQPHFNARENVFLLTDDDDDLNEWGQAGTLDGPEGEVVGYITLQVRRDQHAYHFLCQGAVLPHYREQGGSEALLICALNHARLQAMEFLFEARQLHLPLYFEIDLPSHDSTSIHLASEYELQPTGEPVGKGFQRYRGEL